MACSHRPPAAPCRPRGLWRDPAAAAYGSYAATTAARPRSLSPLRRLLSTGRLGTRHRRCRSARRRLWPLQPGASSGSYPARPPLSLQPGSAWHRRCSLRRLSLPPTRRGLEPAPPLGPPLAAPTRRPWPLPRLRGPNLRRRALLRPLAWESKKTRAIASIFVKYVDRWHFYEKKMFAMAYFEYRNERWQLSDTGT